MPPSSGQLAMTRRIRAVSSEPSGARISLPAAVGPGPDRLDEPLLVVLDQPDRPLDHDWPGSGS